MFVLDEPYISNFAIETLKKNGYKTVFSNEADDAVLEIRNGFDGKIYTNSENSIQKITAALFDTQIPEKIGIFKDKIKFRELIKEIYPDFFYRKISFDELQNLCGDDFSYPFVIKPAIGFLSFGVYTVWKKQELPLIIEKIKTSMKNAEGIFPESVLSCDNFVIEQYIEGEEYAVDVYFDENSKPVILNIFYHPFSGKNDVSDRMYITGANIIKNNIDKFNILFEKIGKKADLKNFPAHIELRKRDENIIPIEVNPLRFAGWCTTDLAYFAYGINIYEYFHNNKKPNWKDKLKNNEAAYAFVMGEVPSGIKKNDIISFDIDSFKKDINAEILECREFDFYKKPMFCVLFIRANSIEEITPVLKLDMKKYIKLR